MKIARVCIPLALLTAALAMSGLSLSLPPPEDYDGRLQTLVKADFHQERLHRVVAALAKAGGVTIYCGRDASDWQVRDIPVTVCADGVPLGTVLSSLADATHLRLRAVKISDKTAYRIEEDPAITAKINSYVQAGQDYGVAIKNWQWDAVARLKDLPPSVLSRMRDGMGGAAAAMSRIIDGLGPEKKAALMSGRPIRLDYSSESSSDQQRLRDFVLAVTDMQNQQIPDRNLVTTDDMLHEVRLTIYPEDQSVGFYLSNSGPGQLPDQPRPVSERLSKDELKSLGLPPRPSMPVPPEAKPAMLGLLRIDWSPGQKGFLDTELTVEVPKGKKPADLTAADFMAAVSRSTGYTVIADDRISHANTQHDIQPLAGKQTTVGKVLDAIARCPCTPGMQWWYLPSAKLILGTPRDWLEAKQNLVPESYLTYVRDKLAGDGLELDDCLEIISLTEGQRDDWMIFGHGFDALLTLAHNWDFKSLWPFYYGLTADQKSRAASPDGLPLAEVDSRYVAASLDKAVNELLRSRFTPRADETDEQRIMALAAKPSALSNLTLMLIKKNVRREGKGFADYDGPITDFGPTPRHTYSLELSGTVDGKEVSVASPSSALGGMGVFPIYSYERQEELVKQRLNVRPADK